MVELSEYHHDIRYKPGAENVRVDALSHAYAASVSTVKGLLDPQQTFGHPGFARFYHFVDDRNLAYAY